MKFLILLCLALTGCAGQEVIKTVTQTKYQATKVPDEFFVKCSVTAPPKKSEYITLTYQAKEDALTGYSLSLQKDLDVCNEKLSKIKQLQDEQVKQIEGQK